MTATSVPSRSLKIWAIPPRETNPNRIRPLEPAPDLEPRETRAPPEDFRLTRVIGDFIATHDSRFGLSLSSFEPGGPVYARYDIGSPRRIEIATSATIFVTHNAGSHFSVYSVHDNAIHHLGSLDAGADMATVDLAVAPNGRFVAAVVRDERLADRQFGASFVKVWKRPERPSHAEPPDASFTLPPAFGEKELVFSPNGSRLAVISRDNHLDSNIRIFDSTTGSLRQTLETGLHKLQDLDWSPDGRHLAFVGTSSRLDTSVHIFRVGGDES